MRGAKVFGRPFFTQEYRLFHPDQANAVASKKAGIPHPAPVALEAKKNSWGFTRDSREAQCRRKTRSQ